ncbi:MAG TPA: hypothetical protein DC017_18570 [Candidatus Wallbacteria bacterium]|nr:hypothetical protein [Candidatus Wallbacteria bacterium]
MTEKTQKIKGLLILKGITITSIAKNMGVSLTFVSLVINQKKKSKRIMNHISGLLGASYEETWNDNIVWEPKIPSGTSLNK